MLRFKDSVRLGSYLTSQLCLGLVVADQIYESMGVSECWVTSVHDSTHKNDSLHYLGRAVDLRTKTLTSHQRTEVVIKLKGRLGPLGFDVLLEDKGGPNEHIHIEWDPRFPNGQNMTASEV